MKQNFTNNDLVKFIYKETSITESLAISEALLVDSSLFNDYQTLISGYIELPKVTFAPANFVLQNILSYSSKSVVEA